MDIIEYVNFIIDKGDRYKMFSPKNILYNNGLTKEMTSEEIHDLVNEIIQVGKTHKYFTKPTKEPWVKLTEIGLKVKELGGHNKYLESQKVLNSNIVNNYNNVNQVNHSSGNIDFNSPIKQKIVHNTAKEPKKKSWIEIVNWIVAIIVGLIFIYEFIIKNL